MDLNMTDTETINDKKRKFIVLTLPYLAIFIWFIIRGGYVQNDAPAFILYIYSLHIGGDFGPKELEKPVLRYPIFIAITTINLVFTLIINYWVLEYHPDPNDLVLDPRPTVFTVILLVLIFSYGHINGLQRFIKGNKI
jgi:hypothetical protein